MQSNNLNKVDQTRRKGSRALGWGIVFIVLGALLLGFNLGFIPIIFKKVLFTWQMLIIFLGIIEFARRHYTAGTVLTVIGFFFLIPRLMWLFPEFFPYISGNFAHLHWPFLLIAIGLIILLNSSTKSVRHAHKKRKRGRQGREEVREGGFYDRNMVFGNMELIVLDQEFLGADLNSVFGQIVLDLRNTNIPEGETAVEVNSVFGSIVILAPAEWLIVTKFDNVVGDFNDKRPIMTPKNQNKVLFVKGSCVFGGGEIRN